SPYNIILGIGYAVDARRKSTPAPLATPAVRRSPAEGRVYGLVLDAESETPVARALVAVVGDEASAQVSDDDGRFVTYPVPVGDVVFEVTHPDYQATQCTATFDATDGSTVAVPLAEATCALTPHTVDGSLRVHVVGKKGKSIPALAVVVRGPTEHRLVSDDTGHAAIDLQPGAYVMYVDDPAYLIALREIEVAPRQPTEVTLEVRRKPTRPRVVVRERKLVLRSQVSFATGSNEILPNSEPLLLEIADVLLRDPALELVEIQGHTDNRGDPNLNMKLSQRRAESVRDWLIMHGVEPARLMAAGYGSTRPLVPNITAHNRARNRRVQFNIVRRAGTNVAATP
ncbi:MAG: OmpA family protein, partial [Polyangiales bacterium]